MHWWFFFPEVVPRLLRHGCTVIKDQVGLKEFNNFHSRRSIFILRGDESAQRAPKDENWSEGVKFNWIPEGQLDPAWRYSHVEADVEPQKEKQKISSAPGRYMQYRSFMNLSDLNAFWGASCFFFSKKFLTTLLFCPKNEAFWSFPGFFLYSVQPILCLWFTWVKASE